MYTPKRYKNTLESSFTDRSRSNAEECDKLSFQVIEQAETHQLLVYNGVLPVEIAEVLNSSSNNHISANIDSSGWSCLISNRTLYIWKYTATSLKRTCFELQLAATELIHKADLTCIIQSSPAQPSFTNNSKTSLINVSPAGLVRYWENITKPAAYVETNLNLDGKKCHILQNVMPYGCVLVTTTNEIYLLSPTITSIHCRQLTVSTGMLSGIGRRVSSFWAQPASNEYKHPPCICSGTIDSMDRFFFIAVNGNLQKWRISGCLEVDSKMVFEISLLKCVNDFHLESIKVSSIEEINVIDMCNTGYGTVLLLAIRSNDSIQCYLGVLQTHSDDSTATFEDLILLRDSWNTLSENMKLTLPFRGYQAFISSSKAIFSQSVSNASRSTVKVELNNDTLAGTGSFGSEAIFLSKKHGLITLKILHQPERKIQKTYLKDLTVNNISRATEETPSDAYHSMKAAFIRYSQSHLNDFDSIDKLECSTEEFCNGILLLSSELVNSLPASDPRWAGRGASESPIASSSVILLNQLQDKEQIHASFIEFLNRANVWKRTEDKTDSVRYQLCEHGEKLQCCISLIDMHSRVGGIIDEVINSLHQKNVHQDSFFVTILRIGEFFVKLLQLEEIKLKEMKKIEEQINLISVVNNVLATCYTSAWQYRQTIQSQYQTTTSWNLQVPWTASSRDVDNKSLLKLQIKICIEQALPNIDSTKIGSTLTQQIILLADLLLDGFVRQLNKLESIKQNELYNAINQEYLEERHFIILSLVNYGYYEQAIKLAEKYEDFSMLILISVKVNDMQRLNQYKIMFKEQGFASVLYKWYMEEGAYEKLMTQDETLSSELDTFLSNHNGLSWLHCIGVNDFTKASNILKQLSSEEKMSAQRKKMMLVMSNLSALASEDTVLSVESNIRETDKEIELLEHQEDILKALRHESSDCSPLVAEDLIKTCLEANILAEKQYITSLDLLHHVTSDATKRLTLEIFAKSILQDSWEETRQLDYAVAATQKMFFKCVKYCHGNVTRQDLIPSMKEVLTSSELFTLYSSNNVFLDQLKVCYEIFGLRHLIDI